MDFKTQQKRFDDIKWYDSIVAGEDRCGCYSFCKYCDKSLPEPCARAACRQKKIGWVKIAELSVKIKDE